MHIIFLDYQEYKLFKKIFLLGLLGFGLENMFGWEKTIFSFHFTFLLRHYFERV